MSALTHCYAMAIVLLAAFHVGATEPASRPITNAETVLAIYTQGLGLVSSGEPKLILAAWKDGYIVWSEDRLRGGTPYYAGQLDPKRLESLLSNLEHDGLFSEKSLEEVHFGPDSQFMTIFIRAGNKRIEMRSWHELYESNGRVVAAAHGLTGLNNQTLFQALENEPSEYLLFRCVWSEVRARAAALVPTAERPVTGDVVMERGSMSWRETVAPQQQAKQDPAE